MQREILLVPYIDVITNPQLRHDIEPGIGRSWVDENPKALCKRLSVGSPSTEPLSRRGLSNRGYLAPLS